ncbi:hypothetical protein [Halobellus sp. Atlit-38R]|nr:hypothetical protein [Halobellus sp. Atlit-38R]
MTALRNDTSSRSATRLVQPSVRTPLAVDGRNERGGRRAVDTPSR